MLLFLSLPTKVTESQDGGGWLIPAHGSGGVRTRSSEHPQLHTELEAFSF